MGLPSDATTDNAESLFLNETSGPGTVRLTTKQEWGPKYRTVDVFDPA